MEANNLPEHIKWDFEKLFAKVTDEVYDRVVKKLLSNSFPTSDEKAESEELILLSVEQTRHLTEPPISRTNLYYWTKANKLQAYKVGKRVFYSKKAVLTFLTSVVKKPPKS